MHPTLREKPPRGGFVCSVDHVTRPDPSPQPAPPPTEVGGRGRPGAYAKGVARRRQILDRAIEVFRERGAEGTSLRRIGEAIGVSHAALLHYFPSREQLLLAVHEHAEQARPETAGPEPGAVEIMTTAARLNVEVPGLVELYSTLLAAALRAEASPTQEYIGGRFEAVRADLAERLRRDQAAGTVRDDVDAEDVAALLVAASDGLQIQWLLAPSIDLERTLETFTRLLAP